KDVMETAPVHFPAHKARLDAFQACGDLIAVGTWADPREGSMGVFRSRAAAEEFVREDPFVQNGVVASYEIKDWNEILLGG
ncbi:MAG TPA: YciI family protein, partial [Polyangiaceae bacterium]|nr:YciI family protein [Polyangiaceae bacterium]